MIELTNDQKEAIKSYIDMQMKLVEKHSGPFGNEDFELKAKGRLEGVEKILSIVAPKQNVSDFYG